MNVRLPIGWTVFSTAVMLICLRLARVKAQQVSPTQGGTVRQVSLWETLFVVLTSIAVMAFGYLLQAAIEGFLRRTGVRFLNTTLDQLREAALLCPINALIPGSITGYAIVSMISGRHGLPFCVIASFGTLTIVDFLAAMQGYVPFREFPISATFNLIGAPAGVVVILLSHEAARRLDWFSSE